MQKTSLFIGTLVFMSSSNFVLSGVEHEKKFYNLGTKRYTAANSA